MSLVFVSRLLGTGTSNKRVDVDDVLSSSTDVSASTVSSDASKKEFNYHDCDDNIKKARLSSCPWSGESALFQHHPLHGTTSHHPTDNSHHNSDNNNNHNYDGDSDTNHSFIAVKVSFRTEITCYIPECALSSLQTSSDDDPCESEEKHSDDVDDASRNHDHHPHQHYRKVIDENSQQRHQLQQQLRLWKTYVLEHYKDQVLDVMELSPQSTASSVVNKPVAAPISTSLPEMKQSFMEISKVCDRASQDATVCENSSCCHDHDNDGSHSDDDHDEIPHRRGSLSIPISPNVTAWDDMDHTVVALQKRLEVLNRVAQVQRQYLQAKGPKVVYGELLQGVLDLMNCEYGFIGEVKYDPVKGATYLHSHATTTNSMDPTTVRYFNKYSAGLKFYKFDTLFGLALTTKKPILSNNPQTDRRRIRGCPVAHPGLRNFLGIPFFRNDSEVMGMIAIANKQSSVHGSTDFTAKDIDYLSPFTITAANLVQAYLQIEANELLIQTVKERTRTLEKVNADLELANMRVKEASAAQLKHFACMSHEIRTPLNCIIGLSSLLLENSKTYNEKSAAKKCDNNEHMLSPIQQESVQMIVSSGDLLLTVVNDVLDYSKLQSGNVEILTQAANIQDVLNGVVHSMETKGRCKDIKIRTFYHSHIPRFVTTDSRRVQQILYNLLGNSVKFSPPGSYIDLKMKLVPKDVIRGKIVDDDMPTKPMERDNERSLSERDIVNILDIISKDADGYKRKVPLTLKLPSSPFDFNDEDSHKKPTSQCCGCDRNKTNADPENKIIKPNITNLTVTDDLQRYSPTRNGDANEDGKPRMTEGCTNRESTRDFVLRVQVKDYGVGIAKHDYQTIFEPFSQATSETERVFGGTGLGLAITNRLVSALGGTISVDSEQGKWTEFTVDLPFHDRPANICQTMKDHLVCDKQKHCMCVIDSNQSTYSYLSKMMSPRCCHVAKDEMLRELLPLSHYTTLQEAVLSNLTYDKEHPMSLSEVLIYLINEDNFDRELYYSMLEKSNRRIVLITYGPLFSVKETMYHFRKLDQVLPSVLFETLVTCCEAQQKLARSLSRKSLNERKSLSERRDPPNESTLSSLEGTLHILIAEDNKINQKVLSRILNRIGMKNVDIVDDGKMAVEQEKIKEYDLILMDMQMPVMGGIEATVQILADHQNEQSGRRKPKIVFVTAHAESFYEQECMKAGAVGFVTKPYSVQDIETLIHRLFIEKK